MKAIGRERLAAELGRVLPVLVCGVALSASLSTAAASLSGGLAIGTWLARRLLLRDRRWPDLGPMRTPVVAFLCACALAALLGIDPAGSLSHLRNYLWVILVPVAADAVGSVAWLKRMTGCVLAGLGFAAYHTFCNHYWKFFPDLGLPGPMTEAGQLVLGIALAGGLLMESPGFRVKAGWLSFLAFLGAALVFNMKRGPWAGAAVAGLALAASRQRKAVLGVLVACLVVVVLYSPARRRMSDSWRDFVHAGNRLHIWKIAADLVPRYPFGIGVFNGTIMQSARYGADAPQQRHFHNNFVTVLVESGPLGLAGFVWWMAVLGLYSYRAFRGAKARLGGFQRTYALSVFCAFLGWNVAGLVEFNFGDVRIIMLLHLLMGGVMAVSRQAEGETPGGVESRIGPTKGETLARPLVNAREEG